MFLFTACGVALGLVLFLAGVRLIRRGLEGVTRVGMERALRLLTGPTAGGVLLGSLVTAIIQSSTVTTTLVVTLVDTRLLGLRKAVEIIMGANIGTTATIQMLAVNVHRYAPLVVAGGAGVLCSSKSEPGRNSGRVMMGIGMLFCGLWVIAAATSPLVETAAFSHVAGVLGRSPLLGFAGGAVLTAVLHSSSVTITVVATACTHGRLSLVDAIPVIMGANVGTCATALLASAWSGVQARRAALAHLIFNVVTSLLFLPVAERFASVVSRTTSSVAGQVANAHTLFNVCGTLLFMPVVGLFVNLLKRLVPDS
ncbi:MAG: Na/Pi symporter [Firmicutes bacterium]|nr:Na/Pi symporter [Bacillota bacterium]